MTALKQITTNAKKLRKQKPGMSYQDALKKSGAVYKSGTKKKTVKTAAKKKPVKINNVVRMPAHKKNKVAGGSGDSLGSVFGKAKKILETKLGKVEVDIFNATKKSDKNKLRKKKGEILSHLRKTNYGRNIKL